MCFSTTRKQTNFEMNSRYYSLPPIHSKRKAISRQYQPDDKDRYDRNNLSHASTKTTLRIRKTLPNDSNIDYLSDHEGSPTNGFLPSIADIPCLVCQGDDDAHCESRASSDISGKSSQELECCTESEIDIRFNDNSKHQGSSGDSYDIDAKLQNKLITNECQTIKTSTQEKPGRLTTVMIPRSIGQNEQSKESRDFNVNATSNDAEECDSIFSQITDCCINGDEDVIGKKACDALFTESDSVDAPTTIEESCQVLEKIYHRQKDYAKCSHHCCQMLTFTGCKIGHFGQHLQVNCQQLNRCCLATKDILGNIPQQDKNSSKTLGDLENSVTILNHCCKALDNACSELIDRCKDHVHVSHELYRSCEEQHHVCELMKLQMHRKDIESFVNPQVGILTDKSASETKVIKSHESKDIKPSPFSKKSKDVKISAHEKAKDSKMTSFAHKKDSRAVYKNMKKSTQSTCENKVTTSSVNEFKQIPSKDPSMKLSTTKASHVSKEKEPDLATKVEDSSSKSKVTSKDVSPCCDPVSTSEPECIDDDIDVDNIQCDAIITNDIRNKRKSENTTPKDLTSTSSPKQNSTNKSSSAASKKFLKSLRDTDYGLTEETMPPEKNPIDIPKDNVVAAHPKDSKSLEEVETKVSKIQSQQEPTQKLPKTVIEEKLNKEKSLVPDPSQTDDNVSKDLQSLLSYQTEANIDNFLSTDESQFKLAAMYFVKELTELCIRIRKLMDHLCTRLNQFRSHVTAQTQGQTTIRARPNIDTLTDSNYDMSPMLVPTNSINFSECPSEFFVKIDQQHQEKLHHLLTHLQQLLITNSELLKKVPRCETTLEELCSRMSKSGLLDELEDYMCQVLGNLRDLCSHQHGNIGKQMAQFREMSQQKYSFSDNPALMPNQPHTEMPPLMSDDKQKYQKLSHQETTKRGNFSKNPSVVDGIIPHPIKQDTSFPPRRSIPATKLPKTGDVKPVIEPQVISPEGLAGASKIIMKNAIRLPCRMIIGMALSGPRLYLADAQKPGLFVYNKETLREEGEFHVPAFRQPWDLVIIDRFLFMTDCYQINIIHRLDLENRCLMRWRIPTAGIRKLSRTKNNNLLVIKYPDSLMEFRTTGELLREVVIKVDGLELSHAIQLSNDRYVVCGTNWCITTLRICVVDDRGNVVKAYEENTNFPSCYRHCVSNNNRTNSNSRISSDERDGYRRAGCHIEGGELVMPDVQKFRNKIPHKNETDCPVEIRHRHSNYENAISYKLTDTNARRSNICPRIRQRHYEHLNLNSDHFKITRIKRRVKKVRNCNNCAETDSNESIAEILNDEILIEPIYMLLDRNDNILVCDYSTNRILLLDFDLNFIKVLVRQEEEFPVHGVHKPPTIQETVQKFEDVKGESQYPASQISGKRTSSVPEHQEVVESDTSHRAQKFVKQTSTTMQQFSNEPQKSPISFTQTTIENYRKDTEVQPAIKQVSEQQQTPRQTTIDDLTKTQFPGKDGSPMALQTQVIYESPGEHMHLDDELEIQTNQTIQHSAHSAIKSSKVTGADNESYRSAPVSKLPQTFSHSSSKPRKSNPSQQGQPFSTLPMSLKRSPMQQRQQAAIAQDLKQPSDQRKCTLPPFYQSKQNAKKSSRANECYVYIQKPPISPAGYQQQIRSETSRQASQSPLMYNQGNCMLSASQCPDCSKIVIRNKPFSQCPSVQPQYQYQDTPNESTRCITNIKCNDCSAIWANKTGMNLCDFLCFNNNNRSQNESTASSTSSPKNSPKRRKLRQKVIDGGPESSGLNPATNENFSAKTAGCCSDQAWLQRPYKLRENPALCQYCTDNPCPSDYKMLCKTESEEYEQSPDCYQKSHLYSLADVVNVEEPKAPILFERPYRLCLDEEKRLLYVASSSVYNGNQLIAYQY